jgi:hypothetical protein
MVSVDKSIFEKHYKSQKEVKFCLGSCAETIIGYEGVQLDTGVNMNKVKNAHIDNPGNAHDMLEAINFMGKDVNGQTVVVSGMYVPRSPNPCVMFNELKRNEPLILTYNVDGQWDGSAVILTGLDYILDANGKMVITKVYVFDPSIYTVHVDDSGKRTLAEDMTLRYKVYEVNTTSWGTLQLKLRNGKIGDITAMVFVDVAKP